MELRAYSDTSVQCLHLTRHIFGDTLISPCDVMTQPLWLEVHITILYPDACKLLQISPDAHALLDILQDAVQALVIPPDAVKLLQDEGFAEVLLSIGPDASIVLRLSTPDAEQTLAIGLQADARLTLQDDGSAVLRIDPNAVKLIEESASGCAELAIRPDAHKLLTVDDCET